MDREKNARFRKVYESAQELLSTVLEASLKTLAHFGCAQSDEDMFERELRRALVTLLKCPEDKYPLNQLQIDGGVGDKRKVLVREVIGAFGGDAPTSDRITRLIMAADPNIVAVGVFSHQPMIVMDRRWSEINSELRSMFYAACGLHRRLGEMLREINTPYRGSARDAEPGVEQTIALLKKFPDVAEPIYAHAGMTGLASYPPVRTDAPLNRAAELFADDIEDELAEERGWSIFKIAGLIVVGIAATVLTAVTLGAGAAVLVGVGIGLATGVTGVVCAHNELQHTKDAHSVGLASQARVDYACGELQGAYALLVVDVATGGLLGRFGGSKSISGIMRLTRVTTISAAGGGIGVACNPNTWKADNVGAIILFGVVVGGVSGAAGHGLGAGMGKLLRTNGTKVQIGVARAQGVLEKGRVVKVTVKAGDVPVDATVVAVNQADCTVTLKVNGQNTMIRIGKLAQLSGEVFSRQYQIKGLRPATQQDVSGQYADVFLTSGNLPVRGSVRPSGPNGGLQFTPHHGGPARAVTLPELSVLKIDPRRGATNIDPLDLRRLAPDAGQFDFYPTRGTRGLFTAVDRNNGRLRIIPGGRQDYNGAFAPWVNEPLPRFDLRGRGVTPQPGEVAMFMAHGSPSGFGGATTRRAAQVTVDAIVSANRAAGPGGTQIKFANLSSCSQGTRRFLLVGKTNAEVFQAEVDMRLRLLGIDPAGPQGITVLAADRPGVLYGADQFRAFGKFRRSDFVPAGTQKTHRYPLDTIASFPQIERQGVVISGIVVMVGGTAGVVTIAGMEDPGAILQWLADNRDKVIGYVFEQRTAEQSCVPLPQPQLRVR